MSLVRDLFEKLFTLRVVSLQTLQQERDAHVETSAELRASEAKLRSYLEAASQAIVAIGGDGRIQLVNRQTEEIFGYSREELLGQELEVLLPDRFRDQHAKHRASYFAGPRVRSMGAGMALAGRRRDGTEFPIEIGLGYVETGEGILALGLVSDITERKRAEDELSRVNAELRHTNVELEQFTYVASHDLQEPLRMITNYLQLLERRYHDKFDPDGLDFLHYAVDGATRMKALIQDLLHLSTAGTQKTHFRRVETSDVLDLALLNLKTSVDESNAVVERGPLPAVIADPILLTQVFQNLIGNAIKFCPPGVRPQIRVTAQEDGGAWLFSIQDNGIGVDPEHAERIFEVFERLNPQEDYAGSGIGLAITRKILERHNGRIWVESQVNQGSLFCFSIPAHGTAMAAAIGAH